MRSGLVPVVAVALLLASGCLGGADRDNTLQSSTSPTLAGVIVEPVPGAKIDANLGALVGEVRDDKGFPVAGVRVSLLQTDHFTDSDKKGEYRFLNVTTGTYVLSASYEQFHYYEAEIAIQKGNATRHDIFLVPLEGSGAGYRPHVHDYWGDQTEKILMDRDVDFRDVEKGSEFGGPPYNSVIWGAVYPTIGTPMALNIPSTPEDPRIVYPGTRELQITLTWDLTDSTVQSVSLAYRGPAGPAVTLPRKPSPASWSIPINSADMTDRGHQWFTLWAFEVFMKTDQNDGANTRPAIILDRFHATVKVIKGELLPEPPHVDHWEGKMEKTLLDLSKVNPRSNTDVVDRTVYAGPVLDSIVPPGTKTLRIFFLWEYDQANGTGPAMDNVLTWKTAADDPKLTRAEHFRKGPHKESGTQWKLYEIDVKPADTDAFYQTKSLWKFLPAQKDFESHSRDYEMRPYKIRMHVTAIRDPTFAADKA